MKITDQVWAFSEPVVQSLGCSIWDVEFFPAFFRRKLDLQERIGENGRWEFRAAVPSCHSEEQCDNFKFTEFGAGT